MHRCDTLITSTKALSSEVVYPEELLIDVLEPISKVKELSTSIQENCKHTLQEVRQDKLKLGKVCDDNIANDSNSLRDPADPTKSLSDEQKQTIIEGGPYQPKLKSYPENPEIQSKKQHKFVYALILNAASKQTLLLVLFAASFSQELGEKNLPTHGLIALKHGTK